MRKILFTVVAGTAILFGCSKNSDKPASIQGTWTANQLVATTYFNGVLSGSDTITSGTLQFDANGNVTTTDSSGTTTGTYTFNTSTNQLTVISNGDTTNANVTQLTSNNLHFNSDESSTVSGFTVRVTLDADYKR